MATDWDMELALAKAKDEDEKNIALNKAPKEKESGFEDFAEGVSSSVLDTIYGIKSLGGELSAEDQAFLKDWRDDAAESGWGTAGRVVGEIGQLAIPGGGIAKGLKGLSKAKKLLAVEAPLAAGIGALHGRAKGESGAGGAVGGLAGTFGGAAIGKGLSKGLKGITKTDVAQKLLNKGVELTPGQSASGSIPRFVESAMRFVPYLATGRKEGLERSLSSWNKSALKQSAPRGMADKVTEIGTKGQAQLKSLYDDAYDAAWSKAKQPEFSRFIEIDMAADSLKDRLLPQSAKILDNLQGDINDLYKSYSPQKLRTLDHKMRQRRDAAVESDPDLAEAIGIIRNKLRDAMSMEARIAIRKVDKNYKNYLTTMNAAGSSGGRKRGGIFEPDELIDASTKVSSVKSVSRGEAPMQTQIQRGIDTVGKKPPGAFADTNLALLQERPALPGMKAMGRAVLGETDWQKAGVKKLKPLIDALRRQGLTSGVVGAGVLGGT